MVKRQLGVLASRSQIAAAFLNEGMQQGQLPDRICIALFTVLSFAEQQRKPAQLNLRTGQIIVAKLLNMLLHGF
ncbi:hypothetical protein D3C80_2016390 [compost metagenome]